MLSKSYYFKIQIDNQNTELCCDSTVLPCFFVCLLFILFYFILFVLGKTLQLLKSLTLMHLLSQIHTRRTCNRLLPLSPEIAASQFKSVCRPSLYNNSLHSLGIHHPNCCSLQGLTVDACRCHRWHSASVSKETWYVWACAPADVKASVYCRRFISSTCKGRNENEAVYLNSSNYNGSEI